MSFGKNPYVPKAEAAEQQAQEASDAGSQVRAFRDAAHQWDRAAGREKPGKKRTEYEQNAARNREQAEAAETGELVDAPVDEPPSPRARDLN